MLFPLFVIVPPRFGSAIWPVGLADELSGLNLNQQLSIKKLGHHVSLLTMLPGLTRRERGDKGAGGKGRGVEGGVGLVNVIAFLPALTNHSLIEMAGDDDAGLSFAGSILKVSPQQW